MNELRAICAQMRGNELVGPECASLTGGLPDADGVAVCQSLDGVARSAYVRTGLRCYAEAPTLAELVAQIETISLDADGFLLDFLRLDESCPLNKPEVVVAVANAINTYPDLHNPQHRFLIVAQAGRLWFGEILAECSYSYKKHDLKPYRTSSSLPSRLARALVNVVASNPVASNPVASNPVAGGPVRTILDPFCGSGSILLEAQDLGLTVCGMDINFKMTGMTRLNLAYFGYQGEILRGSALNCPFQADAIVTDLPYGRLLQDITAGDDLPAILQHLTGLAPLAVYLAAQDLSPILRAAGYADVQVYQVRKHERMSRFVHRARV